MVTFYEVLKFSNLLILLDDHSLCSQPLPLLLVRHILLVINEHLTDDILLDFLHLLRLFLFNFGNSRTLNLTVVFFKTLLLANGFVTGVILKRMLEEHAAGHRVNRLLVHLLDILNIAAQTYFIGRFDMTDIGQEAQ